MADGLARNVKREPFFFFVAWNGNNLDSRLFPFHASRVAIGQLPSFPV